MVLERMRLMFHGAPVLVDLCLSLRLGILHSALATLNSKND